MEEQRRSPALRQRTHRALHTFETLAPQQILEGTGSLFDDLFRLRRLVADPGGHSPAVIGDHVRRNAQHVRARVANQVNLVQAQEAEVDLLLEVVDEPAVMDAKGQKTDEILARLDEKAGDEFPGGVCCSIDGRVPDTI